MYGNNMGDAFSVGNSFSLATSIGVCHALHSKEIAYENQFYLPTNFDAKSCKMIGRVNKK